MLERPDVDAALSLIRRTVGRLGVERLGVKHSLGRRLAEPVRAAADVPGFVSSAMDGYAVRSADVAAASLFEPITLRIGSAVRAGGRCEALAAETAIPISTGAPVPHGADTVVTRECAVVIGGRLHFTAPSIPFGNIRSIGEDAKVGAEVLAAGARVTPDAIGALIGYGVEEVTVDRRPRIALFTTGDELVGDCAPAPDSALITDSNGPMIEAFATHLGLEAMSMGSAADEQGAIDAMLDRAASDDAADIVLSTGGVSGGTYDLMRARLLDRGGTIHFHGVRMRPGKPILFASLPSGKPYFGLPGNPVAALVGLRFFVMAALCAMAGVDADAGQPCAGDQAGRPGVTLFLRGRAQGDGGDHVWVDTALDQRSHVMSSVLQSDSWLRIEHLPGGGSARTFYPKLPERF